MKNIKIIICLILFLSSFGWAQANVSSSPFKRTTATILFASIGGGILGLSTLSFYGKPQEHTDNITTGVLLGFLMGVGYVVYESASVPSASGKSFSSFKEMYAYSPKTVPTLISWNYSW